MLVALGGCAAAAAPATALTSPRSGGAPPGGSVILGDSFKPVTAGALSSSLRTSGNYVLLHNALQNGASQGWSVINDQTGATIPLDPRCLPEGLGPPWVLMSCSLASDPSVPSPVDLYSLTDGTQHTVTLSPGMPYCSSPPYDPEVECSTGAVGADWLEWVASSYHHLPTSVYFQNLQTGELRRDPTNATTFADLNSPALAHATCPGVRLMPNPDPDGTTWGPLTPEGQFALAVDAHNSVILERCGTHLRRVLTDGDTEVSSALASNTALVVWQSVTGRLTGLFLPSLRTFAIPLPSSSGIVGALGLTSGGLYVSESASGAVWRAANPALLPFNVRRPAIARSGTTLRCARGSWRDADRYTYAWQVNGKPTADANPRLVLAKSGKRRSVSCSVTASNAMGTTTASSARLHVPWTPASRTARTRTASASHSR